MSKRGFVHIIGTGAGAIELISLEAIRAIESAQVIVYDDLIDKAILGYANPFAKFIYVGKRKGRGPKQSRINGILVRWARKGLVVARLKGGDSFIFGRGGEEVLALKTARVPYAVVPGITAALAASAASGIPITHRSLASSVVFFTGHREDGSINAPPYTPSMSAVAYMSASVALEVAQLMIRLGWPPETGVAAIIAAYMDGQRVKTCRLSALAAGKVELQSPVIMIFGRHTELFERLPCRRRKRTSVALTRQYVPAELASLRARFPHLNIFSVPLIRIQALSFEKRLLAEMRKGYDAVIITSATTCKILQERGLLRKLLLGKRLFSIGHGTTAAASAAMPAEVFQTASESSDEISGLVHRTAPDRVIYPCAFQRNKDIAHSLSNVVEIPVYSIKNCIPGNIHLLQMMDYVIVSSSMQAHALPKTCAKILSFPHKTSKAIKFDHNVLPTPNLEHALSTIDS